MKKALFVILFLLPVLFFVRAEEYLNGKLITVGKQETNVLYDRTQLSISGGVFQSVYKVFGLDKKLLYTITITHDKKKEVMFFGLKAEGGRATGFTVRYDSDSSGLIYSDLGNTDTLFDANISFRYLVSFTDANREYPVLHRIKSDAENSLVLDPLSRIRLKLHKEQLRKSAVPVVLIKSDVAFQSRDALCNELYKARLALNKANANLTDSVSAFRDLLQQEIKLRFTDNKVLSDERRYSGDLKKGRPDGNGLLIEKGNIYSGTFKAGILVVGIAALKTNVFDYIGQYSNNLYSGNGWLKYSNGSYLLGTFSNAILVNGVILSKDVEGEIYYGSCKNNQRTGYGELRNANGNLYVGEFDNGKLVKGYTKEVDQFGYATYSRVENGSKTAADSQIAEEFFGAILLLKN